MLYYKYILYLTLIAKGVKKEPLSSMVNLQSTTEKRDSFNGNFTWKML